MFYPRSPGRIAFRPVADLGRDPWVPYQWKGRLKISQWSRVQHSRHLLCAYYSCICTYFIKKNHVCGGIEPAPPCCFHTNLTTRPSNDLCYFLKPFDIYFIVVWHPQQNFLKIRHCFRRLELTAIHSTLPLHRIWCQLDRNLPLPKFVTFNKKDLQCGGYRLDLGPCLSL